MRFAAEYRKRTVGMDDGFLITTRRKASEYKASLAGSISKGFQISLLQAGRTTPSSSLPRDSVLVSGIAKRLRVLSSDHDNDRSDYYSDQYSN